MDSYIKNYYLELSLLLQCFLYIIVYSNTPCCNFVSHNKFLNIVSHNFISYKITRHKIIHCEPVSFNSYLIYHWQLLYGDCSMYVPVTIPNVKLVISYNALEEFKREQNSSGYLLTSQYWVHNYWEPSGQGLGHC